MSQKDNPPSYKPGQSASVRRSRTKIQAAEAVGADGADSADRPNSADGDGAEEDNVRGLWKSRVLATYKGKSPKATNTLMAMVPGGRASVEVGAHYKTVSIGEEMIVTVDRMFDVFQNCAYQFNKHAGGTELELNWIRPVLSKESASHWHKKGVEFVNVFGGRLSTRNWTLIVKGTQDQVYVYILPTDRLISFNTTPKDFVLYFSMEPFSDGLDVNWKVNGTVLTPEMFSTVYRELFEALIKHAKGEAGLEEVFDVRHIGIEPDKQKDFGSETGAHRKYQEAFFADMKARAEQSTSDLASNLQGASRSSSGSFTGDVGKDGLNRQGGQYPAAAPPNMQNSGPYQPVPPQQYPYMAPNQNYPQGTAPNNWPAGQVPPQNQMPPPPGYPQQHYSQPPGYPQSQYPQQMPPQQLPPQQMVPQQRMPQQQMPQQQMPPQQQLPPQQLPPQQLVPQQRMPPQQLPPQQLPPQQLPPQQLPPQQLPPQQLPPQQLPPQQLPPQQLAPQQLPPQQLPPQQLPPQQLPPQQLPPRQLPPQQLTASQQMTAPQQLTAPQQMTAPQQLTASQQMTAPQQLTAPQQMTAPQQLTASQQLTAPQTSSQQVMPQQQVLPQQQQLAEQHQQPQQSVVAQSQSGRQSMGQSSPSFPASLNLLLPILDRELEVVAKAGAEAFAQRDLARADAALKFSGRLSEFRTLAHEILEYYKRK